MVEQIRIRVADYGIQRNVLSGNDEIPVSYTHLDVYKRQVYNNTAAGYGGGIYASASNINIAANSEVYNNTAATAGDDLFFYSGTIFTLPNAKDMSGDRILSSDNMEITGWYHDGWNKWNAAQGSSEQILSLIPISMCIRDRP